MAFYTTLSVRSRISKAFGEKVDFRCVLHVPKAHGIVGIVLAHLISWMNFASIKKLNQRNFLRSALIVGYILAVLLFAGLAQADRAGFSYDSQPLDEALEIIHIA